jgi:hypothetical protein
MERRIRDESDEAARQQLRDQAAAHERQFERQLEEQNRLWQQQEDARNRQEARWAKEQAANDRKLQELERETRKSKDVFSQPGPGDYKACQTWLTVSGSKWNPMYWLDGEYR